MTLALQPCAGESKIQSCNILARASALIHSGGSCSPLMLLYGRVYAKTSSCAPNGNDEDYEAIFQCDRHLVLDSGHCGWQSCAEAAINAHAGNHVAVSAGQKGRSATSAHAPGHSRSRPELSAAAKVGASSMPMHDRIHNCAYTLMAFMLSCHTGHSQSQCELLCAAKACNPCMLVALFMGHLYSSALACEALGTFGGGELTCAGLCTAGWG